MRANGFAIRFSLCIATILAVTCASSPLHAAVTASGNNSANPTSAGADPIIGINDVGRLTVNGGSVVTSDAVIIGDLFTGVGLVTIADFNSSTGQPSTWTTNSLLVGDDGTGRLEILNGALVTVDFTGSPGTGDFVVGNAVDGVGTVIVSGVGSMMKLGDDTVIGQNGTGTLRIENEGFVIGTNSSTTDTDIFTVGLHGRLELSDGRLRTQNFTNHGAIVGSGRLENGTTINNSPTGHIDVGDGERLVLTAVVDNDGTVAVDGGEIEFFKSFTNSAAGAELTLRDQGVARFPQIGFGFDSTSGVLATTAGTNDIYGTVRIQTAASKISASGGSTLVFHDPVTNTGGQIEVFAGSSVVYLQGLTTSGSASMTVSLADPDTTPGGAVEVSGDAALAGNLNVTLAAGFKPSAGDAFPIVSATGAVIGSLNLASAPALPGGMKWNLLNSGSDISLSVVATGDYNGNGTVDAGDYIVWRNSQNQQGPGLAADSNGDGAVNTTDYNFWRSRLGNVISGAGSGAAVPEATCFALLTIAVAFAATFRRRIA
jgi:T5SS/PEP-CTERM-associated repeat protein